MPYRRNRDLPASVRKLPRDAQTMWRKVFNAAEEQYQPDEGKAFATAWATVRRAGYGNPGGNRRLAHSIHRYAQHAVYPQQEKVHGKLGRLVLTGTYTREKAAKLVDPWAKKAVATYRRDKGGPAVSAATRAIVVEKEIEMWEAEYLKPLTTQRKSQRGSTMPRHQKMGDQAAATELKLYADNEGKLYPQKQSIEANLRRKVIQGRYDRDKAVKLWMYWVDNAAKAYAREFGMPDYVRRSTFDKPTREMVARAERDEWEDEYLADARAEARKKTAKKKTAKKKTAKKKTAKKKTAKSRKTKKQLETEKAKMAKLRAKLNGR